MTKDAKFRRISGSSSTLPPRAILPLQPADAAEVVQRVDEAQTLLALQPPPMPPQPPPPPVTASGPAVGSLIRLKEGCRILEPVHRVSGMEMQIGIPKYNLSGLINPTTLYPAPAGTRWIPVEPGPDVVPASQFDAVGLSICVINLDGRGDRISKVEKLIPRDVLPWTRCKAFDGSTLDWNALVQDGLVKRATAVSCQSDRPTICSSSGACSPHLTKGGIGCYLSHRKCWKELIESEDDYLLVLEDDIDDVADGIGQKVVELLTPGQAGMSAEDWRERRPNVSNSQCIFRHVDSQPSATTPTLRHPPPSL